MSKRKPTVTCEACNTKVPEADGVIDNEGVNLCKTCAAKEPSYLTCANCGVTMSTAVPPGTELAGLCYCKKCDPVRLQVKTQRWLTESEGRETKLQDVIAAAETALELYGATVLAQAVDMHAGKAERAARRTGVRLHLGMRLQNLVPADTETAPADNGAAHREEK